MTIDLDELERIGRVQRIKDGKSPNPWRRGYPPGEYYEGMTDDFEVCYTAGGFVWYRRRLRDEL